MTLINLAPGLTAGHVIRPATAGDVAQARRVMLDAVYRDLRIGYVPRWHADIIDIEGEYLRPPRHTLLVAEREGQVTATAGVRSHGPTHPRWLARRYPSGVTAQLCRVYVDPAHRRQGLARALVSALLEFVAADGGYQAVYLHTDPTSPGAQAFWRALGDVVHDERDDSPRQNVVHVEIPLPALAPS